MKKLISAICIVAMLASIVCASTFAKTYYDGTEVDGSVVYPEPLPDDNGSTGESDGVVTDGTVTGEVTKPTEDATLSVKLEADEVVAGQEEFAVDVVANLKSGSLSALGLTVAWDAAKLELVDRVDGTAKGTYQYSENMDVNPQSVLWVSIDQNSGDRKYTGTSPDAPRGVEYGVDYVVATLYFIPANRDAFEAGEIFDIELSPDESNLPADINSASVSYQIMGGITVEVQDISYEVPADEAMVNFKLVADRVNSKTNEFNVSVIGNLRADTLTAFGLYIGWDESKVSLVDKIDGAVKGTYLYSESDDINPQSVLWVSIDKNADSSKYTGKSPDAPVGVEYGEDYVITTFTFAVNEDAALKVGEILDFTLAVDKQNKPADVNLKYITYHTESIGIEVEKPYSVGDLNDDGKYNMNDVVTLLKFLAKYDLSSINPYMKEAGDVTGDGATNTLDAVYYLKWIAKWSGTCINGVAY